MMLIAEKMSKTKTFALPAGRHFFLPFLKHPEENRKLSKLDQDPHNQNNFLNLHAHTFLLVLQIHLLYFAMKVRHD